MKIFIATKNQKKLKELKRILIPMGFDVLCEADLDFPFKDAVEDGVTFEENAIIKAKSGLLQTGSERRHSHHHPKRYHQFCVPA